MKRLSPLMQMTLALVTITVVLVLMADLLFGVLRDPRTQEQEFRTRYSEALAVQLAASLGQQDPAAVQKLFDQIRLRTPGLESVALLRVNGGVWARSGRDNTGREVLSADAAERVVVPLKRSGESWAQLELVFAPRAPHGLARWLDETWLILLVFVLIFGGMMFSLYLRRALNYLDPKSVIPERVQYAFDAMSEGVAVVDARGQVLLANQAFRAMEGAGAPVILGKPLASRSWLTEALPSDPLQIPWMRAMAKRGNESGFPLHSRDAQGEARELIVSCASIADAKRVVHGCLVTFSDVTPLVQANEKLKAVVNDLSVAKAEIERKNEELQSLATRDPLTGCLNRRALFDRGPALLAQVRANGAALACVMVDIDYFKRVNDSWGHGVGDRVIREVAQRLLAEMRLQDWVCRYGGEEFCVVLEGEAATRAREVAERLRQRVESDAGRRVREVKDLRITISLGVASLCDADSDLSAVIDRADRALYVAKRQGRNRVVEAGATTLPREENVHA
ncbi:MAG: diguanylate cyclase [Burkholderiaceae bacterium]